MLFFIPCIDVSMRDAHMIEKTKGDKSYNHFDIQAEKTNALFFEIPYLNPPMMSFIMRLLLQIYLG